MTDRQTSGRLDTPQERRRRLMPLRPVETDTFGRFAEQFARFMGTARFILWMSVFIVVWIVWNVFTPWRFDPYAFLFLTLMLSLQASYAAPLILLAQNRQEDRDRVLAEQDRRVAAQSQADMEFLAREMASLRMALGEVATRDYVRSELKSLLEEVLAELDDRDQESQASRRPASGPDGDRREVSAGRADSEQPPPDA